MLNLAAEAFGGFRIADAVRPRNLEGILEGMARRHGTSTAKHCQKTVSKYVLEPLVRDEVIAHNPLKSFRPRLPECRMTNKAPGGQALTPEERGRVLEYLLAIDPNDVNPPKRGHYTVEDVRNLRRAVVEITLLQAVTGLRINEARLLSRANVEDKDGLLSVTVTTEVSKTHRGRTIPILDERVAERMRRGWKERGPNQARCCSPPPRLLAARGTSTTRSMPLRSSITSWQTPWTYPFSISLDPCLARDPQHRVDAERRSRFDSLGVFRAQPRGESQLLYGYDQRLRFGGHAPYDLGVRGNLYGNMYERDFP